MLRLVTPDRRRHNMCQERLRSGGCGCWKAQKTQLCQSCHKRVNLEDCIHHSFSGWCHKECPIGIVADRGINTIEAGFNDVDYGRSFLRLATSDADGRGSLPFLRLAAGNADDGGKHASLLTARRLDFDDRKTSTTAIEHKRKIKEISQESDDFSEDDNDGSDEESEDGDYANEKRTNEQKIKEISQESNDFSENDNDESEESEDGDYANEKRTNEQMFILMNKPKEGEVVAVNALAGCGKTTTIALLCNKIQEDDAEKTCLYLVYNSRMAKEAMQSNKFPQDNMAIRTTHSFVLRQLFGAQNMHHVKPKNDYDLDKIIEILDLSGDCMSIFGSTLSEGPKGEIQFKQMVKTIAGYIRKTVHNFQYSADKEITKDHVFWRAKKGSNLTKRTKWRMMIKPSRYTSWATDFFDEVREKCVNLIQGRPDQSDIDISHDGYLKIAQLKELVFPHDYIIIDEAQDMNACQADLFWGQRQRASKRIYLFGDRFQQVYRFRGASHSFRVMVDASNPKLTLTGSFRFGKNIASLATTVLRALGGDTIYGRSKEEGIVIEDKALNCGVVLCRSQNGIFHYLDKNRPARWCYLSRDREMQLPIEPKQWELKLESFMKEEAAEFTHRGVTFRTIQDVEEFIDDEGDDALFKSLNLLKFLVPQQKSIARFYSDLKKSFYPMGDDQSLDDYCKNGVILTTVHKAKGLEFNCPVLVHDDFHFDAIGSSVVNKDLRGDEGNLLYVAITRAKKHLYLSPKAKLCLIHLSELGQEKVKLPLMYGVDSCRKKYACWQSKWKLLNESSSRISSVEDIPSPPDWGDDHYSFALHHSMSVLEQRHQLLHFLRAYHPDKFFPKHGHRILCTSSNAGFYNSLENFFNEITRKCSEVLASLREEEDC